MKHKCESKEFEMGKNMFFDFFNSDKNGDGKVDFWEVTDKIHEYNMIMGIDDDSDSDLDSDNDFDGDFDFDDDEW